MNENKVQRRFDLDWMRVLAILSVFIFHSARFFDFGGWHVKNAQTSPVADMFTGLMTQWMMPMIFVISAASLVYSLSRGLSRKFFSDKVKRLLIPLAVGIFTVAPPAVYLERLTQHQYSGSFISWLPHYFDGMYAFGGNFAWMGIHLWYLLALLIFTLLFLPVFLLLKTRAGQSLIAALAKAASIPGVIFLFALLVMLPLVLINPDTPWGWEDTGGWSLVGYMPFFLLGFIIFSDERYQQAIIRQRWAAVILTVLVLVIFFATGLGDYNYSSPRFLPQQMLRGLFAWSLIVALLGFGLKHLNFENRFLRYANEAVLPFYILHQTVLLIVGYFVMQWQLPILPKYIAVAVISFAIIMFLYEFLIRRINLLRFIHGMKPLPAQPAPAAQVKKTQPA